MADTPFDLKKFKQAWDAAQVSENVFERKFKVLFPAVCKLVDGKQGSEAYKALEYAAGKR